MTVEQNIALRQAQKIAMIMLGWEVILAFFQWTNQAGGRYSHFLNLVLILGGILLAYRKLEPFYKKEEPSFSVRFRLGLGIGLVAAAIYFVGSVLIYKVIFSGYPAQIVAETKDFLIADHRSEQYIADMCAKVTEKYEILGLFISNFLGTAVQALFLSALLAGALQNTRNIFKP